MNEILKLQTQPDISPRKNHNQLGEVGGGIGSSFISSSSSDNFRSFFSIFCRK